MNLALHARGEEVFRKDDRASRRATSARQQRPAPPAGLLPRPPRARARGRGTTIIVRHVAPRAPRARGEGRRSSSSATSTPITSSAARAMRAEFDERVARPLERARRSRSTARSSRELDRRLRRARDRRRPRRVAAQPARAVRRARARRGQADHRVVAPARWCSASASSVPRLSAARLGHRRGARRGLRPRRAAWSCSRPAPPPEPRRRARASSGSPGAWRPPTCVAMDHGARMIVRRAASSRARSRCALTTDR